MAKANQKQSNGSVPNFNTQLGKVIDDAMGLIERENSTLDGILPRNADTFRRDFQSFELDRPVEKNDSAAARQMAISFHCGFFSRQILLNYGIPV